MKEQNNIFTNLENFDNQIDGRKPTVSSKNDKKRGSRTASRRYSGPDDIDKIRKVGVPRRVRGIESRWRNTNPHDLVNEIEYFEDLEYGNFN